MIDAEGWAEQHLDKKYWESDEGNYWRWAEREAVAERETEMDLDVLTESAEFLGNILETFHPDSWGKQSPIFADRADAVLGFEFHGPQKTLSVWTDYQNLVPVFKFGETNDSGELVVHTVIMNANKFDAVVVAASMISNILKGQTNV
jgi:hypothetical protein